jgi:hypothetical protein
MVELEKLLENYAPGRPEMKPDVIAQTIQLEKDRAKMAQNAEAAAAAGGGGGGQIILQQPGQQPVALNNEQVVQIIQQLQTDVEHRNKELAQMKEEYRILQSKYELLLQRQSENSSTNVNNVDTNAKETIYM